MGLLDSILGAMSGKGDASGQAGPLIGVLSGLLAQSGGLQGLAKQQKQIEALNTGLQKVSAQIELNKPAPQTVLNSQ